MDLWLLAMGLWLGYELTAIDYESMAWLRVCMVTELLLYFQNKLLILYYV